MASFVAAAFFLAIPFFPASGQDMEDNSELFDRYWENSREMPLMYFPIEGKRHIVKPCDVNGDNIPDVMEVYSPNK